MSKLKAVGTLMILMTALPCNARSSRPPINSIHLRTLSGRPVVDDVFLNGQGPFRFLVDTGRIASDPTLGVATPKTKKKLPAHLSLDEVDRLLATPAGDVFAGVRDRAILEVLYSSGLRVSELTGLDWNDVDTQAETVRVLGKGRKERIVPVGRPALRALATYREACAAWGEEPDTLRAAAFRGNELLKKSENAHASRGSRAIEAELNRKQS
jgi:site-specific recombinase XerC